MGKLIGFVGAIVGSTIGWWLGARIGTMTAFILSVVGTGLGLFYARKWLGDYIS